MAQVELIMPKMGESIMEATILKWLKGEGDTIEEEESILEIATDKVDSEIPAPVEGKLLKILFPEGETVAVGTPIALIETESASQESTPSIQKTAPSTPTIAPQNSQPVVVAPATLVAAATSQPNGTTNRFYSPLVLNMARQEGIGMAELEAVAGTGKNGRVTKKDMLAYIKTDRKSNTVKPSAPIQQAVQPSQRRTTAPASSPSPVATSTPVVNYKGSNVEIHEMDRMRRLIADHMVMSKRVSPHVTSFMEVDVTHIVQWRNRVKADFLQKEGQKITFTPIFIEATAKALKDFPLVNASVDGYNVIVRKDINIGMATATPSGNLIVPVIANADHKNLVGLAKSVNDLAHRARNNKLKPAEVQGGTFTITNVGTFGSIMGTPIINQPQVAILAVGAIRKKPAVLETEYGDVIAIRHLMIMSLSYDHRSVDGALGSMFLNRVAHHITNFDDKQKV